MYKSFYENLLTSIDLIKSTYNTTTITPATLDTITSSDKQILLAKYIIGVIFENATGDETLDVVVDDFDYVIKHNTTVCDSYKAAIEFGYNTEYDSRIVVGDDTNDPTQRYYGNNDVKGGDSSHGTHVSGVIGANRNNELGIKGIADNVKIMAIRVVPPNGDERDKDIANAITYAVENGAQVINMSFGKDYSPHKEVVDKAVHYAESKGVLLVHAA
jgi:subtilisin family serine protease